MKKLLLITFATCLATAAFAQTPYVVWTNSQSGAWVYLDTVGGTLLDGPGYRTALLGGPLGAQFPSVVPNDPAASSAGTLQMLPSPDTGVTSVDFQAGKPHFGTVAGRLDNHRSLVGIPWGSTASVVMVAWSGNFSNWYDAFAAAQTDASVKIGVSSAGVVMIPSNPLDPFYPPQYGYTSFAIVSIPEPATISLLGLGMLALLIARRPN